MKDKYDAFETMWACFVAGMGFSLLLMVCISGTYTLAIDAIEQCEKSLPKGQKCILAAVPENKHEKD